MEAFQRGVEDKGSTLLSLSVFQSMKDISGSETLVEMFQTGLFCPCSCDSSLGLVDNQSIKSGFSLIMCVEMSQRGRFSSEDLT